MIKTVGGVNEVLNSYNAEDWVKSAEVKNDFKMEGFPPQGLEKVPQSDSRTFGDFLFDSMNKVNELQKDANSAIELLATGQSANLHETMIRVEQAEIAFKTMNQIRMKVLDAYKEIMKMQI